MAACTRRNGCTHGDPLAPEPALRKDDAMEPPPASAQDAVMKLVAARAQDATVCPSEVARALATLVGDPDDWRNAMPAVHAAVDQLVNDGLVRLSWKGKPLSARSGPYRIGHVSR